MSDIQGMMKFELLPNEIFIEFFEYLNTFDIFHAFDQLNDRFNKLVRNIPWHLDFKNIQQPKFHQFCMKLLPNQELKKQIYSLHLSNQGPCYQIHPFLSRFSLNEFVHLQSLTLAELEEKNIEILESVLPLISQLSYFCLIDDRIKTDRIVHALPMTELRTLVIPELPQDSKLYCKLSSIQNLTINSCCLEEFVPMLKTASELKYLNVQIVTSRAYESPINDKTFLNIRDIHLKQLVIMRFEYEFSDLVMILKQTPMLKHLTIGVRDNKDASDATQWEQLITSSLPHLNIFKFKFEFTYRCCKDTVKEKFQQFQSDFWEKQHHWYTAYSIADDLAFIYTIPCISDTYQLKSNTDRYCNGSVNIANRFDNIIALKIDPVALKDKCEYYFSHVTSITFQPPSFSQDISLLKTKHVESLKMIVSLSNVTHLMIFDASKYLTPSILLEILHDAQQISSLTIGADCLQQLFNDNELCNCLNKMIKKLYIYDVWKNPFNTSDELTQFCKILTNVEHLKCSMVRRDCLQFLMHHLPKLSRLSFYFQEYSFGRRPSWMNEEIKKLNANVVVDFDDTNFSWQSIWIIRDMN